MTLGYRIHTIHKGREKLAPGIVSEFSDSDYREMLRLGAIRAPTADELALYKLANPDTSVSADVAVDKTDSDEPADEVAVDETDSEELPTAEVPKSRRQGKKADPETLV